MKICTNLTVEAAEDAADAHAFCEFRRKLDLGDEELIPSAIVDRLLDGQNPIEVWREYRGLSSQALSEKAGVDRDVLSQIESGKQPRPIGTLRRIAAALDVTIDDLVGQGDEA